MNDNCNISKGTIMANGRTTNKNGQTTLLNFAHCKAYILRRAPEIRAWEFTQVSGDALNAINTRVMRMIDRAIAAHPSIGKTFKHVQG